MGVPVSGGDSGPGGVPAPRGVPAWGVPAPGGVCSWGAVSQHALRQTPLPPVNKMTDRQV